MIFLSPSLNQTIVLPSPVIYAKMLRKSECRRDNHQFIQRLGVYSTNQQNFIAIGLVIHRQYRSQAAANSQWSAILQVSSLIFHLSGISSGEVPPLLIRVEFRSRVGVCEQMLLHVRSGTVTTLLLPDVSLHLFWFFRFTICISPRCRHRCFLLQLSELCEDHPPFSLMI